ncbi:MAG: DUF58 domain-containing protein [Armatimonadota bacterium]
MDDQLTTEQEPLLTPDFLRKLEQLSLVSRRVFAGKMRGERRSTKRGASVEFADYRNYTHGDDFRRVDWNVYARLEKLFLKLFVEEEDLHIYILIDASKSMEFGSPSKLLHAKRIAAALSYIGLANLDRVGLAALSGSDAHILQPKRGKQSAHEVFRWLECISPSGQTDLAASIRDFSLRTAQSGVVIVLSDFLCTSYPQGLITLLARKFEPVILHILDQDELQPPLVGDLLLIDSETGERREVTITQTLLRKYQQRLSAFKTDLESFCVRYGCTHACISNRTPFEDLVLNYLRQKGTIS